MIGLVIWFRNLWVVVVCVTSGFSVSDSICFLLYPNKFVGVFFVRESCKRITERRKERDEDTLRFQLYFLVSCSYSIARKCFPGSSHTKNKY